MAVPYPRVRVTLGGTILTAQSWSTAINMAFTGNNPTGVNQATLDAWIANRVVNVRDWWTTNRPSTPLAALASTGVQLTFLRAYYYPSNSDVATLQSEPAFGTALAGLGTPALPPQTSMVISTRTGTPGRRGRGRMYLPIMAAQVGNNARFQTGACDVAVAATAQLLTDFSTSSLNGNDMAAVVASTAGAFPITRVEADNDVDTQRRRSDKLLFTYKAQAPVTQ